VSRTIAARDADGVTIASKPLNALAKTAHYRHGLAA